MFNSNSIYKAKEIKPILANYHKLSIEVKIDVDRALESTLIDGQMYLFLALHYHHGFSLMTSAKYMGLNLKEVLELNDEMLECVEAVMNGYRTAKNKHSCETTCAPSVVWSELLLGQYISPFDLDHFDDVLLTKDELGREVLRQRKEGKPEYVADDYTTRAVDENADGFELDRFLVNERHNNGVISLHEGV